MPSGITVGCGLGVVFQQPVSLGANGKPGGTALKEQAIGQSNKE
jgi:hypothetical protein